MRNLVQLIKYRINNIHKCSFKPEMLCNVIVDLKVKTMSMT